MKKTSKLLLFALAGIAMFASSASADTCVPLGAYTLASPCNPASFKIYGNGPSGQSVGTTQGLITGNSFQVGFDNNSSASDVLIIGVFSSSTVVGSLNGISFTSLLTDPFDANHNGAIHDTLAGLGFPTNNLAYGWLDLGQGIASGSKLTVNMAGISSGDVFYAEAVDPFTVVTGTQTICDQYNKKGKCTKSHTVDTTATQYEIDNINANSEAGVVKFPPPPPPPPPPPNDGGGNTPHTPVPEPTSILLLGSALIGVALRRRQR